MDIKWTYLIQQKLKLATLLMTTMLLIILFNIIERRNIREMNRSVTSIYNDRLIPATDIFYITESLYSKKFLLEKFLESGTNAPSGTKAELLRHDEKIRGLVRQYEKTYLVDKESAYLREFKELSLSYSQLESKVLKLAATDEGLARSYYDAEGRPALMSTVSKLSELTKLQSAVGNELLNNSKGILATSDMLSTLQIVLAIVIGVMIMSLIAAAKITTKAQTDFNLN